MQPHCAEHLRLGSRPGYSSKRGEGEDKKRSGETRAGGRGGAEPPPRRAHLPRNRTQETGGAAPGEPGSSTGLEGRRKSRKHSGRANLPPVGQAPSKPAPAPPDGDHTAAGRHPPGPAEQNGGGRERRGEAEKQKAKKRSSPYSPSPLATVMHNSLQLPLLRRRRVTTRHLQRSFYRH